MRWGKTNLVAAALLGTAALVLDTDAHAFCGFFVSGADAELTNNASQVVLMRKGSHLYNASAGSVFRSVRPS